MVVYLRCCKDTAFFHRFQIFLKLFCCEIGCTNTFFHKNMLFNIKKRVLTLLFAISIAHRTKRLEFIWKKKQPLTILIVGAAPIRLLDTDVTLGRDPHQPWAARKRKMSLIISWRGYSAQMRSVAINAIGWTKKNNEPQQTFFSLNKHSIKKNVYICTRKMKTYHLTPFCPYRFRPAMWRALAKLCKMAKKAIR